MSEAMAVALHDIAQPLGAALLSVEAALVLLDRQQVDAGRTRIASASDALERSNWLLRALKVANGAEPSPWRADFDVGEVLNSVWSDLHVSRPCRFHGDRGFVQAALIGLSLTFAPDVSRTVAVTQAGQGSFRLRLLGKAKEPTLVAPWLRALRKTGIKASSRPSGGQVSVMLTIALAPGATKLVSPHSGGP